MRWVIVAAVLLSGCAAQAPVMEQAPIARETLIRPVRPKAPPEGADQRAVSIYLRSLFDYARRLEVIIDNAFNVTDPNSNKGAAIPPNPRK